MARVLVTRAPEQAEHTARALAALGHVAVVAPLRRRDILVPALAGPAPGEIVMTSQNAIAGLMVPETWRDVRCRVVGEATAVAARAAGFRDVVVSGGDVRALLAEWQESRPRAVPLLYLTGRPRKPDLELGLAAGGWDVVVLETYRMVECASFPPGISETLRDGGVDAALHFSAESAAQCLAAFAAAGLDPAAGGLRHLALSAAVGQVLQRGGVPDSAIRIAAEPSQPALLARLAG